MSETNEDLLLSYANEAVAKIKIITDQVERMKIDEELYRMQMTAISVACLQNTDNSKWQRIDRASPYWTPAYQDVCSVVDIEIALRIENERLKEIIKRFKHHGTDGCLGCETGRITLYHVGTKCILCDPKNYEAIK